MKWFRPDPNTVPAPDLAAICRKLDAIKGAVEQLATNQARLEKRMSQITDAIDTLVNADHDLKSEVGVVLETLKAVPGKIEAAVAAALAANPAISPDDLATITAVADDLKSETAQLAEQAPPPVQAG